MGTVCLSLAPTLRCVGLSRIEELVTLIPAGLEVIFSMGLVFAGRDAGSARFILVAEGPTYFLLALLSFLGRIIPLFQTSLVAFKVLDIAIGAASSIPIILYTSYIYLFKRKEFFPRLPKRFSLFASAFSLILIPIIIVTNEIGSFLGITYRKVPSPISLKVGAQLAVGPNYSSLQFGREFLTSTSLALLTIYQAITFLIIFSRLVDRIMAQRNIEDRAASEREGVLFRGIGWLAIGMKVSAVESALGFASMSFGIIMVRRVLRFLGRACFIIGIVKGLDYKENFLIIDRESLLVSGTRKLTLPGLRISSPRLQRSPLARRISRMVSMLSQSAAFASPVMSNFEQTASRNSNSNDTPRDPPIPPITSTTIARPRPAPLTLSPLSATSRVTVSYDYGPPTLVLNFSPMDLPSGNTLAIMSVKQRKMKMEVDPVLPSSPMLRSAPLLRFSNLSPRLTPGLLQGRKERLIWDRGRFHTQPPRQPLTTPHPTSAGALRASVVPEFSGSFEAQSGVLPDLSARRTASLGVPPRILRTSRSVASLNHNRF